MFHRAANTTAAAIGTLDQQAVSQSACLLLNDKVDGSSVRRGTERKRLGPRKKLDGEWGTALGEAELRAATTRHDRSAWSRISSRTLLIGRDREKRASYARRV